jgi:hypothetical protein
MDIHLSYCRLVVPNPTVTNAFFSKMEIYLRLGVGQERPGLVTALLVWLIND